jgi:hypothetical protein
MSLIEVLTDLIEENPSIIELPPLHVNEIWTSEQKFSHLYLQLQRKARLKQRQLTLYYAFYIGELIESITSRSQKAVFRSQMTTHFYQGCIRTYYIFLNVGIKQIFRSKIITLVMLKKLRSQDFQSICQDIFRNDNSIGA